MICPLKILTDTVNATRERKKKITIRCGWVKGSGTQCLKGNFGPSLVTGKWKESEAMEMS